MLSNKYLFTKKQLTHLIWPLLVEQLLSVLVGMVDVLMVSYVGEATVSGVSLVDSVNHLIIQVLFALTAGGTVVCAKSIGAKDMLSAKKGCGQLLLITTGSMLALTALFFIAGAMVILLQSKRNMLWIDSFRHLRPERAILRQILSIGVPGSVESALFNLGKVMLQSLVSTLGTASIAAYAVAGNLVTYLYLPGNAMGTTITTVVGQCIGAGESEQARYYTKKLVIMDYLMLIPICAVMIIGRGFWVSLYNLSAMPAILAAGLVLIHSLGMILWPLAFLLPYYFRATGKAVFSMLVAVAAMAIFRVGLAYLFVMLMHRNVLWIWYAMLLDWLFRVLIFVPVFIRRGLCDI